MKNIKTIWFDDQGIGSATRLSYLGWDFADCADVLKRDDGKYEINITEQLKIICSKQIYEKLLEKCSLSWKID